MKNLPRQHHILPAFYLAGFTDTGTIDGLLYVYDYFKTKHYRASPRQVCRQRDFYRIYEPGEDPNALEYEMSRVESEIAPVLQEVIRTGRISDLKQVGTLLSLAALIHARNRRGRFLLAKGLAVSLAKDLAAGMISREKWEKLRGAELRAGVDPADLPEYDTARDLLQRGEWSPRAPQVLQVGLIPQAQQWVLDRLVNRKWELMLTEPENGGFIASDSPLVWGSLEGAVSLGYMLETLDDFNAEITFPLSRSLALVSYAGARQSNFEATDYIVARINSRTQIFSTGLLCYSRPDFMLLQQPHRIAPASEYFKFVRQARKHGMLRP